MTLKGLSLLQGIFLIQRLNPGLLHCRRILYCMSHQVSPKSHLHPFQVVCGLGDTHGPSDIAASHSVVKQRSNPLCACANLLLWFTLSPKSGICFPRRAADTWEEDGLQGSWRYRHYQIQTEKSPGRHRDRRQKLIFWYSGKDGQPCPVASSITLRNNFFLLQLWQFLAAKTVLIWKSILYFV